MTTSPSPPARDLLARSLAQIKQLRRQVDQLQSSAQEPIAVIGIGLRIPSGIASPWHLRERLRAGFDAISDIPPDRWDLHELFDTDPEAPGKMYTRHGAFLDGLDGFDAQFFGISPKEAAAMDPQQRLFLEVTHEALERAGQDVSGLMRSNTAVFAGASTWDYGARQAFGRPLDALDPYVMSGNIAAFISGRVAYTYGLQGPCMTVDTACSSSLVAVHLAITALRRGETDMAVAGGVNVMLAPEWNVVLSRARMMAVDGRCKTFDAAADGYVRGEGCGALVLKRLSRAQRDGDEIAAVLRGSAINQDGPASGLTVPNGLAQQQVIRSALRDARIEPTSVGYVEAHGTGTSLGDPIEVRSLAAVYGPGRSADHPLRLGSIKTNIGHLEPAAGIVGLIKAVLSVEHGEFYPHLHLRTVNPEIELESIPAQIPTTVMPWEEAEGTPRRAAVSSFGASGTNAHVIVEQAPPRIVSAHDDPPEPSDTPRLLVLSAKSDAALEQQVENTRVALSTMDPRRWSDLCATSQRGRAAYTHRAAVVARDPEAAARILEQGVGMSRARASTQAPRVAMVFAGQGSQALGMGRQLYERLPVFREAFDRCDEILRPRLGHSLHDVIAGAPAAPCLDDTALTQPAIFAVEYALAQQWHAFGVEPSAVLGHSVGQYVAATIAGVFELEAGLRLIAARGRMMQEMPGEGAMASLLTDESRARRLVEPHAARVSIAAINGPASVVVSGLRPELDAVVEAARAEGIKVKSLSVSHAFHSPQMDPMLEAFAAELRGFELRTPRIPLVCNLDGQLAGDSIATPEYWVRHARQPVRFADGLATLLKEGHQVIVEASPRPTLASMARDQLSAEAVVLPSLRKGRDELETMLRSVAEAFVRGVPLEWSAVDDEPRRSVPLPTYPFQRRRHWVEVGAKLAVALPKTVREGPTHPLLDRRVPNPLARAHFEADLGRDRHRFLADFVIDEVNVVNIGIYLEMLRGALAELDLVGDGIRIVQLAMQRACLLRDDGPSLQLVLQDDPTPNERRLRFSVHGNTEDEEWVEHCGGAVVLDGVVAARIEPRRDHWDRELTGDALYEGMRGLGIELGPAGRWITRVRTDEARTESHVTLRGARDEEAPLASAGVVHPGLIDALFQAAYAVLPADVPDDSAYMLVEVEAMDLFPGSLPTQAQVSRRGWDARKRALTVDIVAADGEGHTLIAVEGAVLKYASRELLRAQLSSGSQSARGRSDASALGRQWLRGLPEAERPAAALRRVLERVLSVFGGGPDEVDVGASLLDLGLDSLMAVELKGALEKDLAVSVPLGDLLGGPTVTELATLVLGAMVFDDAPEPVEGDHVEPEALVPDPQRAHEPFSLTDLQQAYLIGRGGAFELGNVSTYFFLEVDVEAIDLPRAEDAWNQLVSRHGMLRAVFTEDGRQRILPQVPRYSIEVEDLRDRADAEREEALAAIARSVQGRVFDTGRWPLFEIRASRIDERRTRLHLGFDALVVDAWSTSMLFQQWAALHRGETLPSPSLSFRDYMVAVDGLRGSERYARDSAYWDERIETLPAAPELPLARSPESLEIPRFGHRTGRLEPQQWSAFQAHARQAKVTPSAALCSVYAEVIARWSRNRRFSLNLLFFNRMPLHPAVKDVVANFSSTTLLEIDATGSSSFTERSQGVQRQLADDLEHGLVTGVEVLRRLNRRRGGRGATMPVVFASTINLRARDRVDQSFGLTSHLLGLGEGGREVGSSIRTPQVWLDHQVLEEAGGLVFNWDVVEDLFPEGMIDAMFSSYTEQLRRLAADASAWDEVLGRHPLPAAELSARRARNETRVAIAPRLLHEAFVEQAERAPERVAVITRRRVLTYGELDRRSEVLARSLLDLDLGADRLVAVVMPKGWEQIVAVLAIHKAGGAYLPIDPSLPTARVEHLFRHAGAMLAISVPSATSRVPEGVRVLSLRAEDPAVALDSTRRLRSERTPDSLAYVIYTSGSTGLPKGVAVSHAAAWNTIADINHRFEIGADDRAFAISSLSFDLSVYDIFGLLAVGGALVIPEGDAAREPTQWLELVREYEVTVWSSVPALMQMLGEHVEAEGDGLGSLRLAMLSGDWIPVALPGALRRIQPELSVVSLGGATEAAIWSIHYPIAEVPAHWSSIPYGRPLANQRFAVLDDDLEPRPVWVPGQLHISGDGLAMGYWNDPERSAASFFEHPHRGERLYRTGDVGRYLPSGDIEFLGRDDGQVKVQGYRIELGEIDSALDRLSLVKAGVCAVAGDRMGSRSLVAYVVPHAEDDQLDLDAVRERLAAQLPPYMVPTTFVALEALPLTSNGKIDRKALPAPDAVVRDGGSPSLAPRDELEHRLCEMWAELLELEQVGVHDDFFALGGQSFLAMRLMARIRQRLGRTLALASLVSASTVAAQAELLRREQSMDSLSPLVRLAGEGAPSVVLVHPVGGNVLCYSELARALAPRAVHGLVAPGLAAGQPALGCIVAMAERYLEAIDEAGVDGALRLGGWSLGGVVAFEMARQAEAAGRSVERVVMIDSRLEARPGRGPRGRGELLAGLLSDLGRGSAQPGAPGAWARQLEASAELSAVLARAHAEHVVPSDLDLESFERLWEVYRAGIDALDAYRPVRVRVPVLEIIAADEPEIALRQPWSELCLGVHDVHRLPGDHYTLLQPPHRTALEQLLLRAFE